jgi:hypothetical protein
MGTVRRLVRRVEGRWAPAPRYVIAGTGQCGTTYAARVLQEAGIRCGHEEIFSPSGYVRSFRLSGDASYFAVLYLPDYRGKVVHLVRNPVHVVRSLVGTGLLSHTEWRWVNPLLTYFDVTGDPVLDAMRFYLRWNRMIEPYADLRVRIEDFDQELPNVLRLIAPWRSRFRSVPPPRVPTDTNTKRRAEGIEVLEDLPAGPDRDQLAVMGASYGYDLQPS